MGEISEMMLDGFLCEGCGDFLDDKAPGHPRRCHRCGPAQQLANALKRSVTPAARKAERHNRERRALARQAKPFQCHCGKLFRTTEGMTQHQRDKHPPVPRHDGGGAA